MTKSWLQPTLPRQAEIRICRSAVKVTAAAATFRLKGTLKLRSDATGVEALDCPLPQNAECQPISDQKQSRQA